ncbi:MAG: response regulator [Candidatus Cloacimonetes bacterium]|nr:response regulator [Candidatus Cloacimonadota bacterium]
MSRYKELLIKAPFAFALHRMRFDQEGKAIDYVFLEVNEAFENSTGLKAKDIIGKTLSECLPHDLGKGNRWVETYEEVCKTGRDRVFEEYSDALQKWFLVFAHAISEDMFTTIFMDTTKSWEMQSQIQETKDRFHLISRYSADWMLLLDKDLNVRYSSDAVEKILGFKASSFVGSRSLKFIHPDDRTKLKQFMNTVLEEPEQTHNGELRILDAEGGEHWVDAIATNLLHIPAINAILLNIRENTQNHNALLALNESEEQLRIITENVSDIIFVSDKTLNTIWVSPSVQNVLGETVEEHLSRQMHEKHSPESRAHMRNILLEEIALDEDPAANRQRTRIINTQYIKTDGSVIDISMHISFLRDENGKFKGLLGVSRDVTEQLRYEKELKQKNVYIESLLNAIPDLMFILEQDGTIADVKAGINTDIKIPRQHLIGRNVADIDSGQASDKILSVLANLQQSDALHTIDIDLETEGEKRAYEARITPYEGGKAIALLRDVNSERRAIEALTLQGDFQRMIVDISTDFLKSTLQNLSELIDEALARVGKFFGVHRAYVCRYSQDYQSISDTNEWHNDHVEALQPLVQNFPSSSIPWWSTHILASQIINIPDTGKMPKAAIAEKQILASQNVKSILCVPIVAGQRVLGYFGFDSIGVYREFSESVVNNIKVIANVLADVILKQEIEEIVNYQNELQDLLTKIATQYISMPSDKMEESIQSSLADMGEFTSSDRVYVFEYDWDNGITKNTFEWTRIGISAQILNLQTIPLADIGYWTSNHLAGKYVYVENVDLLSVDDPIRKILEPQSVRSTIALPMMKDDLCIGFVGFDSVRQTKRYTDKEITLLELYSRLLVNLRNRVELENNLRQEKEKAEAASKAKSEFLANMSHEIRTPLNGVIGFTELMLNSTLNSTQQSYAQNVVSSSYNLLGIINDILDFSKIEAGKLELELLRTDIIELVEHAADIVKIKTAQKKIELLLEIDPQIPRYAVIDPLRVNQILVNLLSNAAKFTEQGEVHVKLEHRMTDGDHADITFTVRDTGIGIKPQQRKMLFRAFSQLDSSTTRRYGGTGLGLIISSHLAQMMNSHIDLDSEEGKGSVFSFTINARVEVGERAQAGEMKNLKKVLIVDDNQNNLTILQHTLLHWGLTPICAIDGLKAVEVLQNQSDIDAMVLDYNMPYLNGINTMKMIRSQLTGKHQRIPAILLHSSAEDAVIINECKKLDIHNRLVKPVKTRQLYNALLSIDSNSREITRATPVPMLSEMQTVSFDTRARILIAEDNILNLTLLKEMIIQQITDAEILEASDGLEAIKAQKEHEPHLILMDVQMPNMDGISATREIRKTSQVPIIAITAGALKEERQKCLDAGMNDFVTKPVLAAELRETMLDYLSEILPQSNSERRPQIDKHLFNYQALMDNLSQDEETLYSLLDIVQNSIPTKLEDLKQAIDRVDLPEMKAILHSIRGSAQNMYFIALAEAAAILEKSGEDISKENAKVLFDDIMHRWHEVLNVIVDFKLP